MPVIPGNPAVEPSFQLRNLYSKSTQNIDVVSFINFSNLSVSYLYIILFNSVKSVNIYVT